MRNRFWFAAAAMLLSMVSACSREEPPKRTPPPDAKRVDAAKAGVVSGRVAVDGPLPANPPIQMNADPACAREHKGGVTFQTYVSEAGGLGNVFVYVKDGLGSYYFDTPAEPVKLDQKGCQYIPHVFGVQVGQNIEIVNSDPVMHNVHALGNVNPEFNFGQPIQSQKDIKFFPAREVMVRFKCEVHNWMNAYVGVLDHPYFAVTSPTGQFELKNLPAGTYTIEAWHERLGTQTQTVTLADNDSKAITFTFKSPAATAP